MKQKIKQMLIKFLGIDELERLVEANEELLQEVKDLSESNEYELNDRPNFYDMESQVEELVGNEMADVIERIEALEE
jgi:predicted DNA binding CopG/RHH family protein|tara:strand:- start:191 stop:421 length:231 start_codon:yes stop_codon:yes gene_type:complete